MKILIGVDGSAGSFEAVRMAGCLAAPDRDVVAMYYSPPTLKVGGASPVEPTIVERAEKMLAAAVFQEARSHAPAALQPTIQEIVGNQPARTGLAETAQTLGADLIAVGARGAGPLERLMLGSVSRSTLHHAKAPVLVARSRPHEAAAGLRILVAIDDAASAAPVLAFLARLSWPAGVQATLFSVIAPMLAGEMPAWLEPKTRDEFTQTIAAGFAREHEHERQAKQSELEGLKASLPSAWQSAVEVAEGYPSEQILAALKRREIDLAVLGARDMGAIARWVLGSTSEKIVAHAPCSVLIVHGGAE